MTNLHPIERWFSGKALQTIRDFVIPTLAAAEAQGYWPKGASRRVCAALNKQAVAQKFARSQDRRDREHEVLRAGGYSGLLCDVVLNRQNPYCGEGGKLVSAMMFGAFTHAPTLLATCDACERLTASEDEQRAIDRAREWCQDFAPVADLVRLLDSRRPPICIAFKTLSKTVIDNLFGSLHLDHGTLRTPETECWWEEVEVKGKKQQVMKCRILWPEGTKHNQSRYAYGSGNYNGCHACGHAIKRNDNWIPIVVDNTSGTPLSFWIGRDCARNLFGAEVEGDAIYEERAAVVR